MSKAAETIIRLKDLVQKHSVVYEVWPEQLVVRNKQGNQIAKVGFDLELHGTHEHGHSQLTPGCEKCMETFQDLRKIAGWIVPQEERPSFYEIQPFDGALHQAAKRKRRFEVALSLKILHRHGHDRPVDECQQRCLKEMQVKLAELGVRQG